MSMFNVPTVPTFGHHCLSLLILWFINSSMIPSQVCLQTNKTFNPIRWLNSQHFFKHVIYMLINSILWPIDPHS